MSAVGSRGKQLKSQRRREREVIGSHSRKGRLHNYQSEVEEPKGCTPDTKQAGKVAERVYDEKKGLS